MTAEANDMCMAEGHFISTEDAPRTGRFEALVFAFDD